MKINHDIAEIIDKAEAIFVIQEGWIKFANEKSAEIVGYSMEEILASNAIEVFVHPDDREMVAQHHASRLREEEEFYQYDFRVVLKAGNVRWVKVTSSSIMWEGKPALICILDDITERKRLEEELKLSEEKFSKAFLLSPDAISMSLWFLMESLFLSMQESSGSLVIRKRKLSVRLRRN